MNNIESLYFIREYVNNIHVTSLPEYMIVSDINKVATQLLMEVLEHSIESTLNLKTVEDVLKLNTEQSYSTIFVENGVIYGEIYNQCG